jgi:hypothetical protein
MTELLIAGRGILSVIVVVRATKLKIFAAHRSL